MANNRLKFYATGRIVRLGFLLFIILRFTTAYSQQKAATTSNRGLERPLVLNKNLALSALQAQNRLHETFGVHPMDLDTLIVHHRARYVEIEGRQGFIGDLGYWRFYGLLDLVTQKFIPLKIPVVQPRERFKKKVVEYLPMIEAILVQENLYPLDSPFMITNVYGDHRGLYFDLIIETLEETLLLKIDHRFTPETTRVILLE